MSVANVIYAIIFIFSVSLFIWSVYRRISILRIGKRENRFTQVGKRLKSMLVYAFFQKRVINRPYGLNHLVIFWAFMILLIANTEFLLHGLFPDVIALSLLPKPVLFTLAAIFDIFSILALASVLFALIRRIFFAPDYIDRKSRDAYVILSLIAGLMIFFFGMHAGEIALGIEKASGFMPVSKLAASVFFSGMSEHAVRIWIKIFWWGHAVMLLGFLNYLPFSKHMHIMAAIPNCFFRSLEKVKTQAREEFRKGNTYGAGQVDQFRWSDLLDTFACTECGRCTDVCPAANTKKSLNPKQLIHDIKINIFHNGSSIKKGKKPDLPLIGGGKEGSVSRETIWDCTTCRACMEICPVFIEHIPKIVEMRRYLVEMKSDFPEELLNFFENIENRSNPWGIAPSERAKWCSDIDVRIFEEGKTEFLYYVGCAGAFDTNGIQITKSVAKILNAAGVSWGILGPSEPCCGDSIRRLGNEYLFDRMARDNIKLFKERGIKKIIVSCPHGYSTLKNDYAQFGADFEVIHYTEFINRLIGEGKLKFKKVGDLGKIVYHDSCYLGRYNDIYEQPRNIIKSVTGKEPYEIRQNRDNSFCCGAGGGRMWLEENSGERINNTRYRQAVKENPDTICTNCPYCMIMFQDALKDEGSDKKPNTVDLAEIVARALE